MNAGSFDTQRELEELNKRPYIPSVIREELMKGIIERKRKENWKERVRSMIQNIVAVVVVILFILYLINYHFYLFNWFARIFTGECKWWSLGFICTY